MVPPMTETEMHQALEAAHRAGIDLDLLDTNLALSVAERLRQHDLALGLIEKLEEAKRVRDGAVQPASAAHR